MSSFFDFFFSWNASIIFSVILILLLIWEFFDKNSSEKKIDDTEKKDPFGLLN